MSASATQAGPHLGPGGTPTNGVPHRGPHLVLSREEIEYLHGRLDGDTHPLGVAIRAKAGTALSPVAEQLLQPHK